MKYRFYILMGVAILLLGGLVIASLSLNKQPESDSKILQPEPSFEDEKLFPSEIIEQNLLSYATNSVTVCSEQQTEGKKLLLKVEDSSTIILPENPAALDQEIVSVMFNAFKHGNDHAVKLWIELFDKCLEITQTRVIKRSPSDYTWIGKINNDPLSNVLLTVGDQIMFGRIEYSGNIYKIEPIEDGLFHRTIKLDPTKIMPFDDDVLIP